MKLGTQFALLSLSLLLLLAAQSAAAQVYAEIFGQNQGPIDGDATFPPETGSIEIDYFKSSVQVSFDSGTGLPTGRRQHQPFVVLKKQDSASLGLLQALMTNESLDAIFRVWAPDPNGTGATIHIYTVELQNARMVEFEQSASSTEFRPMDAIQLVYQNIRWTDEITGQVVSETWMAGSTNVDLSKSETKLLPLPNPTKGATVLRFDLPESVPAELIVYDLRGREVRRLYDGLTPAQRMAVSWDGKDDTGEPVARGMYMVKLKWPEGETTQRVTMLR